MSWGPKSEEHAAKMRHRAGRELPEERQRTRKNEFEIRANHAVIFLDRTLAGRLECLIDVADLERVTSYPHKWCAGWRKEANTFYVQSRGVLLHRFLMNPPDEMEVDHKFHDGLDNRRENLIVCTPSQNCQNRRMRTRAKSTSSTPHRNVYFHSKLGKYRAQVSVNGLRRDISGSFTTAEAAAEALRVIEGGMIEALDRFCLENHDGIAVRVGSELDQNSDSNVGAQ